MSSGKLLVVDARAAAQSTSWILNTYGYTAVSAQCTNHALDVLRSEPRIELVAAALTLPGGESGASLISHIQLCYRSTAVMLVAQPGEKPPDSAVPVLRTPFSPSGLIERVEILLEESRRARAALISALDRNRTVRGEVYASELSLHETVARSRRLRTERFCHALRITGVTPPLVLVVDDDFVLRDAICRFLTQQRFRVLAAANGEEALTISRAHDEHIDLLLTDLSMPGMTGRELIEILSLERPHTRTLLMTGDDIRLPGPTLRKPFEMEDLLIEVVTSLVKSTGL